MKTLVALAIVCLVSVCAHTNVSSSNGFCDISYCYAKTGQKCCTFTNECTYFQSDCYWCGATTRCCEPSNCPYGCCINNECGTQSQCETAEEIMKYVAFGFIGLIVCCVTCCCICKCCNSTRHGAVLAKPLAQPLVQPVIVQPVLQPVVQPVYVVKPVGGMVLQPNLPPPQQQQQMNGAYPISTQPPQYPPQGYPSNVSQQQQPYYGQQSNYAPPPPPPN